MSGMDEVMRTLRNVRNANMENNAFFSPAQWAELVAEERCIINENMICAAKDEGTFQRVYYSARSAENLKDTLPLINQIQDKPITIDIVDKEPTNTAACKFFADHGFRVYSVFERMAMLPENTKDAEDVGVDELKTANSDEADDIYDLLCGRFDPLNSHLPTRDEIREAVRKKEIVYIGESREIFAFAYWERTNRMTKTLRYIYTTKAHRRKGLARKLIEKNISGGGYKVLALG